MGEPATHFVRWASHDGTAVYVYASVHMPYRQAQAVAAQKTAEGARSVAVLRALF